MSDLRDNLVSYRFEKGELYPGISSEFMEKLFRFDALIHYTKFVGNR